MAFDNVRLPDDVEKGAEGGPKFQTSIIALGNGSEQRNVDWLRTRSSFDIAYGIQNKTDFSEVIKFFYARQGKARGFRFKDWSDFEVTDQAIGEGDGATVAFQLIKDYTSLVTYRRTLTRIVTGSVVVKVNGVTTAVTVNVNTGIVTFSVAPAAAAVITASCEFDIPVRFDTDELRLSLETFDAASIGSIPLVEIYE